MFLHLTFPSESCSGSIIGDVGAVDAVHPLGNNITVIKEEKKMSQNKSRH